MFPQPYDIYIRSNEVAEASCRNPTTEIEPSLPVIDTTEFWQISMATGEYLLPFKRYQGDCLF